MAPYRIDFDEIAWSTPAAGVRAKIHRQEGKQIRLVEFAHGFVEPDWCTKGHIGYILEGKIKVDFDRNTVVFGTGDGIFIPADEKHKHKGTVLTNVVKIILVEDA